VGTPSPFLFVVPGFLCGHNPVENRREHTISLALKGYVHVSNCAIEGFIPWSTVTSPWKTGVDNMQTQQVYYMQKNVCLTPWSCLRFNGHSQNYLEIRVGGQTLRSVWLLNAWKGVGSQSQITSPHGMLPSSLRFKHTYDARASFNYELSLFEGRLFQTFPSLGVGLRTCV
jgi:hypothetical protein